MPSGQRAALLLIPRRAKWLSSGNRGTIAVDRRTLGGAVRREDQR
jgi:hypothetical protein